MKFWQVLLLALCTMMWHAAAACAAEKDGSSRTLAAMVIVDDGLGESFTPNEDVNVVIELPQCVVKVGKMKISGIIYTQWGRVLCEQGKVVLNNSGQTYPFTPTDNKVIVNRKVLQSFELPVDDNSKDMIHAETGQ